MGRTAKPTRLGRAREIPRSEWETFFRQFSKDHQEWWVEARSGGGGRAAQEAHGMPFEALTLHLDHNQEVLSIVVRKNKTTKGHAYQSIPNPNRVTVEDAGSDVRLCVDSTNRASTIISLHRVATPDYDAQNRPDTGKMEIARGRRIMGKDPLGNKGRF